MKKHVGRRQSRLASLLVAFALGLLGVVGLAAPAAAASTSWPALCSGNDYSTCTSVGYTDHGYGGLNADGTATNSHSYWNMYAGHNYTNYAAYMAIQNGAKTPSVDLGVAADWANNAKKSTTNIPVNGTPAAGAIAQYNAYAGESGASGHVAYVESVAYNSDGSPSSITISEDNFQYGPFRWRKIPAGDSDWPSNFIHFADLTTASTSDRIGVLDNGTLEVKQGPISATWTAVGGGSSFELSPNRIAVYDGSSLNVKEGGLNATWTTVTGQVDEYHVTDNRVGIRIGTQIFVKEGPLSAPWVHVADGISFAMSPNRLAVYDGNWLNVKEGNIYAGWTTVTGQVDEYHVTDTRIGIRVGSTISIKDGPIGAPWTAIGNGSSFQMSPNRIALYDGQLHVKEGPVNAMWTTVTGAVDTYDVTDDRVGMEVGGQLYIKDGPLNATWTLVGGGSAFDLS